MDFLSLYQTLPRWNVTWVWLDDLHPSFDAEFPVHTPMFVATLCFLLLGPYLLRALLHQLVRISHLAQHIGLILAVVVVYDLMLGPRLRDAYLPLKSHA